MECWSDSSSGHYLTDIPFILAGQGAGKCQTGRIVDAAKRNNNDLLISVQNACGIASSTFGWRACARGLSFKGPLAGRMNGKSHSQHPDAVRGSNDEKVPIIMMGLDVDELDDLDAFMSQVAATFRTQRLLSPPETSAMFVTLVGSLTAAEFKRRWTKQVARDPISFSSWRACMTLRCFMAHATARSSTTFP